MTKVIRVNHEDKNKSMSKLVPPVKALDTKLKNLSSIPRTHTVEGRDQLLPSCLQPP